MSDNPNLGFTKFVPGFDFLQNLAKGASQGMPQMPGLSNWVAPTLNVEELEKRIEELKAVHFWLDQNFKALGATIQALEVQKMTLATLQGMNFNMGEVAEALKLKAADAMAAGVKATEAATQAAGGAGRGGKSAAKGADGAAPLVDPLQWWGALTQQFQQIAADALKDAARNPAMEAVRGMAEDAMKAGGRTNAAPAAAARPPGKAAAKGRKSAARKTAGR